MFEDSLLKSQGTGKRAGALFTSLLLQGSILTVMILLPLIFTDSLEASRLVSVLVAPPPPPPPPPPPAAPVQAQAVVVKTVQVDPGAMIAPTEIPKEIARIVEQADTSGGVVGGVVGGVASGGMPGGVLGGILGGQVTNAGPPPPPPPQRIGGDVAQANLITQVKPQYPALAKAARVQDYVMLQATISKQGTIEDLKVLHGHPLLNEAAIEAVKQWRYKPQTLNGQAIEVITTITVNFSFQ